MICCSFEILDSKGEVQGAEIEEISSTTENLAVRTPPGLMIGVAHVVEVCSRFITQLACDSYAEISSSGIL